MSTCLFFVSLGLRYCYRGVSIPGSLKYETEAEALIAWREYCLLHHNHPHPASVPPPNKVSGLNINPSIFESPFPTTPTPSSSISHVTMKRRAPNSMKSSKMKIPQADLSTKSKVAMTGSHSRAQRMWLVHTDDFNTILDGYVHFSYLS